jgi:RNA recognition motif-containing protein
MQDMSTESTTRQGGNRRRNNRNRGPRRFNSDRPSAPAKKSFFETLFGWLFKKKPAASGRPPRTEPRFEKPKREPREDRAPREEKPPVPVEIISPKLYVGNLAYETVESDLFDAFSKVGAVKNVEVVMDRNSGKSKGFGFVEMETLDSAKAAAEKFNRTDFMGRTIVVNGAKTKA